MTMLTQKARTSFELPATLSATEPPEYRGLARDEVRLLVASPDGVAHAQFRDLPNYLRPGDLLVVNNSATRAAAFDGVRDYGSHIVVHLSTHLEAQRWIIELRKADRSGPILDGVAGEQIAVPNATITLIEPYEDSARLHEAIVSGTPQQGRAITYGYVKDSFPLDAYQTVFAREPGSAEMPSAARPFTERLALDLVTRGIWIAPITLHCGVSSLEFHEAPLRERFAVSEATATLVNDTRAHGGRVIAVGTTAVRALESAVTNGLVVARSGWTDLIVDEEHAPHVVDGLITGLHAPEASHLLMLEAIAPAMLVQEAYDSALEHGYLWHEFGDSSLLLPV
ncbi:MAG: S-adenosylmethionine:tRNA ribosyltransferase-isomerase [Actinomycetota bacterium]